MSLDGEHGPPLIAPDTARAPAYVAFDTGLGLPALDCENSAMQAAWSQAVEQPGEVWLVARLDFMAAYRAAYSGATYAGRWALHADSRSPGTLLLAAGGALSGQGVAFPAGPQVYRAVFDGSASALYVADTLFAYGQAGANALDGFTLCAYADGSAGQTMRFFDVFIIKGLVQTGHAARLRQYITARYGL